MSYNDLTIQDIDYAWLRLLKPLARFSDGREATIAFDAYSPEDRNSTMPGISIRLDKMVPNYRWRQSGGEEFTSGFTRNQQGIPTNEIREYAPIPWVFQYIITVRTDNPIHDRELMLKIGCLVSEIAKLEIITRSGTRITRDARLEASTNFPLVSREVFKNETDSIKKTDQKKYERNWYYTVPIDLPDPRINYERVTEMITWRGGVWESGDDTYTIAEDGTVIKVEQGIASNVPNQVDLGNGLKATIGKT